MQSILDVKRTLDNMFINESILNQRVKSTVFLEGSYWKKFLLPKEISGLNGAYDRFVDQASFLYEGVNFSSHVQAWEHFLMLEDRLLEERNLTEGWLDSAWKKIKKMGKQGLKSLVRKLSAAKLQKGGSFLGTHSTSKIQQKEYESLSDESEIVQAMNAAVPKHFPNNDEFEEFRDNLAAAIQAGFEKIKLIKDEKKIKSALQDIKKWISYMADHKLGDRYKYSKGSEGKQKSKIEPEKDPFGSTKAEAALKSNSLSWLYEDLKYDDGEEKELNPWKPSFQQPARKDDTETELGTGSGTSSTWKGLTGAATGIGSSIINMLRKKGQSDSRAAIMMQALDTIDQKFADMSAKTGDQSELGGPTSGNATKPEPEKKSEWGDDIDVDIDDEGEKPEQSIDLEYEPRGQKEKAASEKAAADKKRAKAEKERQRRAAKKKAAADQAAAAKAKEIEDDRNRHLGDVSDAYKPRGGLLIERLMHLAGVK